MRVQRQPSEEVPANGGDQQPIGGLKRAPVLHDPDPHAHLTPAERYELAIQRRDALLHLQSEPSR